MVVLRSRNNTYYIDYRVDGKRIVKSTKTSDLATAKRILKETEAKITLDLNNIRPNIKK
jgi:hypothetical protein